MGQSFRLCGKDGFEARKDAGGLSLCSDLGQRSHKIRLFTCIYSRQSLDLPLANPVHCFYSLECSFCRVKRIETLRYSYFLLDRAMVLFDYVVEAFHSA
jgi:hypothetical protein